jgi:integrase/recombinase XerD
METVILRPLYHRERDCIGINFNNLPALNKAVRKVNDCRWTKTFKCWYTPLNRSNYLTITKAFAGLAITDNTELKTYLLQRQKAMPSASGTKSVLPTTLVTGVQKKTIVTQHKPLIVIKAGTIQTNNAHVMPALKQQLILKAYSSSTIRTYLTEMSQLLQILGKHNADDLTPADLRRYFVFCFEKLKLSENTLHSRINGLKFYYEQVLKRDKFFWEIPRPKKPLQLPKLLNEEELRKLFNALTNKKHKAMLFTAYSAGLRVSEIVGLKINSIDSKRMQILIERAKGKKDRYVNLSPVLLDILRKYIATYQPKPREYLFESEQTGKAYPTRTVQQIFNNAKHKSGIKKDIGIHSLRHSFATHLLDKGTDIRYIKDLLGHFDIRTTERYLHVSKQKLVNIISPLDDLMNKEAIEW